MDYESLGEEEPGVGGRLAELWNQFNPHVPKVVALLVIAAAVYYFLFLFPRPASVTVSVSELDGGLMDGVEVYFTNPDTGKTIGTASFTEGGVAVFNNMPSGRQLQLHAEPGPSHKAATKAVSFASGGQASEEVSVERRSDVEMQVFNLPSPMSEGCSERFTIQLTNYGDEFPADFVAEGDFAPWVTFQKSGGAVMANESRNFTAVIDVPRSDDPASAVKSAKGAIRLKRTRVSTPLSLALDVPLSLEVSPPEIRFSRTSQPVYLVSLYNRGKQTIRGVRFSITTEKSLAELCGGEGGGACFSIDKLSGGDLDFIPPESKLDIGVRISPPQASGVYLANLLVSASCLSTPGVSVPITVDLSQG